LLAAEPNIPFVLPGFEAAAIGFFDRYLTGGGIDHGIGAQDAGNDFIRRQVRLGFSRQRRVAQASQQKGNQRFHSRPISMTGTSQKKMLVLGNLALIMASTARISSSGPTARIWVRGEWPLTSSLGATSGTTDPRPRHGWR
jgi:hypothetical protein